MQNQKLDKKLVSDIYSNGKKNGVNYQVLTKLFQTMNMIQQSKKNPGLYSQQINQNINNKMIPKKAGAIKLTVFPPDPKAVYIINKPGALNTLQRQCTIVDKGIQQKQQGKAAKLIQIVGFKTQIQTQKTKNNEKLDWIKDNKQYPLRIIIRDKQNKIKALYFKTKQQAQKVRVYYVCKFLYQGNVRNIMQESNKRYTAKICQNFKSHLFRFRNQKIARQKQQKQKNKVVLQEPKANKSAQDNKSNTNQKINQNQRPFSKQMSNLNSRKDLKSQFQDPVQKQEPQSLKNPNNMQKSQKGYNSDLMKSLINKQQSRKSSIPQLNTSNISNNLQRLTQAYKKNLFQTWFNKAKAAKQKAPIKPPKSNYYQNITNKTQPKPEVNKTKPQTLTYKSIQFLKQTNIFIKPIVIISLRKSNTTEAQSKFNTIIQKKDPHLGYQLVINSGQPVHSIKGNIVDYQIGVRAIDYLTNSQICNDRILLKSRFITEHLLLMNNEKTVRIQIMFQGLNGAMTDRNQDNNGLKMRKNIKFQENPEGSFLQIDGLKQGTVQEIRSFWEKQSIIRGYYNVSKDIKIIQILELSQQPPKFWVMKLSQSTYKIVNMLNSASHILKFKLTQSILPVLNILTKLYSQNDQLVQVCLSIIVNYMSPYYFINQFNKTNKLHHILGLVGEIEFSSKIGFQMQLIKKIVKMECIQIVEIFLKRNISYVHALYQYIYEIFAKNFPLKVVVQLWNFLFKDPNLLPIYMILICVWLIKFYQPKLQKCSRFRQIVQVLQSHQTCEVDVIIREIIILRQKYFNMPNNTIIDSIKDMFNTKPLQHVVVQFYKRQTERLDKKKQNRDVQKNVILQKLCNQISIQIPKYPHRVYCLHIYFYNLPPVPGSLYIKANNIEYQCISLPKTKYFIVGDVRTQIGLQFINNRSDQFTCKLQCMQGINRYTVELKSTKSNQVYRVEYLCGLLTESYIEVLKKNRKFDHFIGAFMKQQQLFDQFLRPITQCSFLNVFSKKLDKDDLGKKIKVIFSTGSKNFDQIQFYLRWIYICPITLPEKMKLIRQYATSVSQEYFLSSSQQLSKIFIQIFLKMTQLHITSSQFQCYYSDCLQYEFKAPKIAKCRFTLPNGNEYKLQNIANAYICAKSQHYLHQDIVINELIQQLQKQLEQNLGVGNITEGIIGLVYSTNGQIRFLEIPVIKKKSGKQLVIDQAKFQQEIQQNNDVSTIEPQVLVTQVLPTFSKISTILDFVNNSKSIQSLGRVKQQKNVPESVNLLKNCDIKFNKILTMRYHCHPTNVKIPFFNYYHELISDAIPPHFPKNIFLNNLQTDLKTICMYDGTLNFSDNKRIQSTQWDRNFGLYGNLRIVSTKIEALYFTTVLKEEVPTYNALIFINYGFGIYRWQPCIALGYSYIVKQKLNNLKKQKKAKKYIFIRYQNVEKFYKDFQIKMEPKVLQALPYIQVKNSVSMKNSARKPGQMTNSKREVGSISNKNLSVNESRRKFNV